MESNHRPPAYKAITEPKRTITGQFKRFDVLGRSTAALHGQLP